MTLPSTLPFVISVPDAELAAGVSRLDPFGGRRPIEIVQWDLSGTAPRSAIDLVVLPSEFEVAERMHRLSAVSAGLVQWQSIGYDNLVGWVPAGHVVANAGTVHESATAEFALTLMLAAQRSLPRLVRSFDAHEWDPFLAPGLADRTVMLLGYGGVNKAVAARLAGFEPAAVVRVASRARRDEEGEIHGIDELPELLPTVDIVVIAVPLGTRTHGLVGERELALLPDGALIVNVARGPVLDTEAVLRHAGRLRFALDVTDPEPLPEEHSLWSARDVFIAPHVGGASTAWTPRLLRLIERQIRHLAAGEEPENVVLRG